VKEREQLNQLEILGCGEGLRIPHLARDINNNRIKKVEINLSRQKNRGFSVPSLGEEVNYNKVTARLGELFPAR